jgi:hypothetical protein
MKPLIQRKKRDMTIINSEMIRYFHSSHGDKSLITPVILPRQVCKEIEVKTVVPEAFS